MDSLLASYAFSDEEDERPPPPQISSSSLPKSALFSALPPPKSSGEASSIRQPKGLSESPEVSTTASLFSSLPQPKTLSDLNPIEKQHPPQNSSSSRPKSALFYALPPPKSSAEAPSLRQRNALGESPEVSAAIPISSPLPQLKAHPGPDPNLNPKKVVQFKPPTPTLLSANPITSDDEEDDEEQDRRTRKQSKSVAEAPSVKSFLSSMPAARHSATLGVSGSGRRSIIDTEVPEPASDVLGAPNDSALPQDAGGGSAVSYGSDSVPTEANYEQGTAYGSYDPGVDYNGGSYGTYHVGTDPSSGYASYEGYYGQYENKWVDKSGNALPEGSSTVEIPPVEMPRKRGRKVIPTEIVEVKQDDLMKNRPREDQVKMTGIAFGPAYQPASTKGKPSKLHKRKHQIGSLYFDMKQKETELAERRSKGFLTKAETQAKYGW